jgi:hypothetical protein
VLTNRRVVVGRYPASPDFRFEVHVDSPNRETLAKSYEALTTYTCAKNTGNLRARVSFF